MGEILGLGVTHYPGLIVPDEQMDTVLKRALASDNVPLELKNPTSWPEPMRREWEANRNGLAARDHRRRLVEAFRRVRQALDDFAPDFVLIWGDDQYENFREDGVPPFCVFALEKIESRPFKRRGIFQNNNIWGETEDRVFTVEGHRTAGTYIARQLLQDSFDVSYAYKMRYELGLPHAFINTILFLDYDRRGFPYRVVPVHVNCHGSSVISKHGIAHLHGASCELSDPPGPSPERCFAIGVATARALAKSPWRVAVIASSSWSHGFLTEKNHWLYPDVGSDRTRFEELRDGTFDQWCGLTTTQIEEAGQQEFLNWICLAGAMRALGQRADIVDYIESFIFNSNKCFAIFRPS